MERLFKTLQDRLVKEMRLARVETLEEANRFLGSFLRDYNRRFSKAPRESVNLHRPLQAGMRLDHALCIKKPRVVANDGTIQVDGQRLQLLPKPGLRSLALRGVRVTVSSKGLMRVFYEGGSQSAVSGAADSISAGCPDAEDDVTSSSLLEGETACCGASLEKIQIFAAARNLFKARPKSGHFYLGEKRTFLNWLDTCKDWC